MLTLDTVTLDNLTLTGVFTDASTVTIDNTVTLDGATSRRHAVDRFQRFPRYQGWSERHARRREYRCHRFTSTITLESGSTLTALDGTDFGGATIVFAGTGATLILDQSSSIGSSTISGFGWNDTIDLGNLTYSTTATDVWDQSAGTLTITSGGVTDILHLVGTYTQSDFMLIGDGTGGTSGHVELITVPLEIATGASVEIANPVGSGESVKFDGRPDT